MEIIRGFVKIHRSPPITELTFLNQLKVVTGRENRISFLVFENHNLQEIFNWKERDGAKLKLSIGDVEIYNNALLCNSEIQKFKNVLERKGQYNDLFNRNGYLANCGNSTISTETEVLSSHNVTMKWNHTNLLQAHQIDAYIIQYAPIKSFERIDDSSIFERASCSNFGWQQVRISG